MAITASFPLNCVLLFLMGGGFFLVRTQAIDVSEGYRSVNWDDNEVGNGFLEESKNFIKYFLVYCCLLESTFLFVKNDIKKKLSYIKKTTISLKTF